jgi:AraC family transcriptional activator of pobA
MANGKPYRIKSIGQFHKFRNLPKPEHPLISVIRVEDIELSYEMLTLVQDYYSVSLKRNFSGKFRYGQQEYDFDEGIMLFVAPGQVFQIQHDRGSTLKQTGWMLLMHPDFFWNTPLARNIKQYEFFSYSANEALFLSPKEEKTVVNILKKIQEEYHTNIDSFSQGIIISQIETLLNYSQRFYQRQFITRKVTNHKILDRLERLLTDYFNQDTTSRKGLPTVQFIAESLNVSPGYLSGLLKVLTGQSTQQHIHDKLIEKAKEKLSTSDLSVGEIAYELGFEHSQSFSKLFKSKTNLSPLEFRQSFN